MDLEREGPSCESCGSSVRQRQLVSKVTQILDSVKVTRAKVLGVSDAPQVAEFLSGLDKVSYTNTFYDAAPKLDIARPSWRYKKRNHLVVCSDVLEHVMHPIGSSIRGLYSLLRPGGFVIATVPYSYSDINREHYPWMVSYKARHLGDDKWDVVGLDSNSIERVVNNPVFHGGPGNTLEMRLLSRQVLLNEFVSSGFEDVNLDENDSPSIGVRMQLGVLTGRKPLN
jgi:SAM-dependent methyltransferase